jgi:pimeloyl-ACP methyl ester carboxylesterase
MSIKFKSFFWLLFTSAIFTFTACEDDNDEVIPGSKEEMVNVGGYELFTRISGNKTPTIVLMGGLGGDTEEWKGIEKDFAEIATVVNYDREGLGKSAWQKRPKDSETIAKELHALLRAKKIPTPYVLVVHSLGGIHARVYLSLFKSEVAGMVLVDPTAEDIYEAVWATLSPEEVAAQKAQIPIENEATLKSLPEGGLKEEFRYIDTCFEQVRALKVTTNAPIAVISSMKLESTEPLEPLVKQLHKQLRDDFLAKTSTGKNKHYTTQTAGHYVQADQPALVLEAVNWVLSNL